MSTRRWWRGGRLGLVLLIALFLVAMAGSVQAQDGDLPPRPGDAAVAGPLADEGRGTDAAADVPPLGEPGLSFRYVQTFGLTEQPYFEDSTHLNYVNGVAVDGNDLWIAEERGRRALRYNSAGALVNQIGQAGLRYGTDTSFETLNDVAIGTANTIWLVDRNVNFVVQFDQQGNILKVLGSRYSAGSDNSRFDWPYGVAVDSGGNVFVSDTGNERIQIFDNAGNYRATLGVTGECGTDNGHLCGPRHLDIGPGSLLYVADHGNHRIQIFNVAAPFAPLYVATIGVTGESGNSNDRFEYPAGVTADSRYIYVADEGNHRVQVFTQGARDYAATLGTGWGAGPTNLRHPTDVAVAANGTLYIADNYNARVQQYDANLTYVKTLGVTGVPYLTDGNHYNTPSGLAVAQDNKVYLTEEYGNRLLALNAAGVLQWSVGAAGVTIDLEGNDRLNRPTDVALAPNNNLYVADANNDRIQIFNPAGGYVATLGNGEGEGNDQFSWPNGVFVTPNGTVYVADTNNHRVQVFTSAGAYMATIGISRQSGVDNQHFDGPRDVAVDGRGILYVVDTYNHRVQVFDVNRNYLRTLGITGEDGNDFAHFAGPSKIAIDGSDRVYVASQWEHYVLVFDKDGKFLTRLGGFGNSSGNFNNPHGLAVNQAGELYVADFDNHRIQKFAPGVPNWVQRNINGFGHPGNSSVLTLETFQGRLYAGIDSRDDANGARRIMRSSDGSHWESAVAAGFGSVYNYAVVDLTIFNGQLYAGTSNWNWDQNHSEGGSIWRSLDGAAWSQVVTGGFGDANNGEINRLVVFDNHLLAATNSYSDSIGLELWRSATGNDGDWTRVVVNGFGHNKSWFITTFEEFQGSLYAGVYNATTGGQLWRSADGITWTPVTQNGFGNVNNSAVASLEVFDGAFYASVRNTIQGGEIWRSANGTDWTQVAAGGFGDVSNMRPYNLTAFDGHLYVAYSNEVTGVQMWRSQDGELWQPINQHGWGDSKNQYTAYDTSVAIFDEYLYIGAWNTANGGEVWQYLPDRVTLDITNPAVQNTLTYTNGQGGQTQVIVPSGAVTEPVTLVYEPTGGAPQPAGMALAGRAFELTAFLGGQKADGFTFQTPVNVVIAYTAADVLSIKEETLLLLRWNSVTGAWEDAACGAYVREPAQNRITAPICHLSTFGLMGETNRIYLPSVKR